MMARFTRGIEERQEQKPQQLIRDTRPLMTRFADYIQDPNSGIIMLVACGASCFLTPAGNDLVMLFGIIIMIVIVCSRKALPFRMPQRCHMYDPNDPLPN